MCDFCENIIQKKGRNFELYEVAIVYDTEEKEYSIADDMGEYLGINYCPVCGRKLSDGKENPSTEELLAKLKEKMTEDDYKTLQNGMKSFTDGVNTLWSVLRKGIENDKTENQED